MIDGIDLTQLWELAVSHNVEIVVVAFIIALVLSMDEDQFSFPFYSRFTYAGTIIIAASVFYQFTQGGIPAILDSVTGFIGIGLGLALLIKDKINFFSNGA